MGKDRREVAGETGQVWREHEVIEGGVWRCLQLSIIAAAEERGIT